MSYAPKTYRTNSEWTYCMHYLCKLRESPLFPDLSNFLITYPCFCLLNVHSHPYWIQCFFPSLQFTLWSLRLLLTNPKSSVFSWHPDLVWLENNSSFTINRGHYPKIITEWTLYSNSTLSIPIHWLRKPNKRLFYTKFPQSPPNKSFV